MIPWPLLSRIVIRSRILVCVLLRLSASQNHSAAIISKAHGKVPLRISAVTPSGGKMVFEAVLNLPAISTFTHHRNTS